jgi:transposase-like protein
MAQTRGGISAKQIERETGVTYKTAWRMCKLIRSRLDEDSDPFSGEVEVDESYFGGRRRGGKRGRGAEGKTATVGIVQRRGRLKAVVVPDVKQRTIIPIVRETVSRGSMVYTDELNTYNPLALLGYGHGRILHSAKVYVMGNVHTNTIENFWSLAKRGISGVYHSVSAKYLQHYINEYAFRYNHRDDEQPMFQTFLQRMGAGLDARLS